MQRDFHHGLLGPVVRYPLPMGAPAPPVRADSHVRRVVVAAATVLVFVFCWFEKFNDPIGSFNGLSDDHLFYAVRGWQLLFGEWPSRDFVDHGAPLHFALSAVAQAVLGRGALAETLLTLTALALGVAITFRLVVRASGSIGVGLFAVLFQMMLGLRLYNYPKILVYALAIGALWSFADRPSWRTRTVVALVTAFGFLLRHDHGLYVGLGMLVLLVLLDGTAWRERLGHAAAYGATVVALLAPYLLYLQVYGGIVTHFVTASTWAARDRGRAAFEWPSWTPVDTPVTSPLAWLYDATTVNLEWAIFYTMAAWPVLALLVLLCSRSALRPDWPHARAKLGAVVVLAAVTSVGFLRSPLFARFADVSVPQVILLGWLLGSALHAARSGLADRPVRWPAVRGVAAAAAVAALLWTPAVRVAQAAPEVLDRSAMLDGPAEFADRVAAIARSQARTWPLENWLDPEAPGAMRLALFLHDCTAPTDHVFVSGYLPQAVAMANRPFAGGHADLRPGFFATEADQHLTIARFERQSVPIAVVPRADEYEAYRAAFPLVTRYFDQRYTWFAERDLGDGVVVGLLVERGTAPTDWHPLVDAPCYP